MQVSSMVQLKIVETQEREYAQMIYNQVLNKRVGEMTKDEGMVKAANGTLVDLEKKRDALLTIKQEIEQAMATSKPEGE